jgi:putative oxidoreductase|tara:strand:- start:206 stop:583 length:378 start_codon:yes stop_codon:yes gene_type:complete
MHIVEAFGRMFISALFIIEAIKKFLFKEETIFYMEDYGVPEILFFPSLIFELVVPILLIIGYQTRISALAMFVFTIIVTIIFHNDFENQMQLTAFLKNFAIAGGFLIIASNKPNVCTLDYYLKNK